MENQERQTGVDNELHPRHLSPDEIEDPTLVLDTFFNAAHLPQVRDFLWDFLRCAVAGEFVKLPIRERSDLLSMHRHLERLVEAAHLIRQGLAARNIN